MDGFVRLAPGGLRCVEKIEADLTWEPIPLPPLIRVPNILGKVVGHDPER